MGISHSDGQDGLSQVGFVCFKLDRGSCDFYRHGLCKVSGTGSDKYGPVLLCSAR